MWEKTQIIYQNRVYKATAPIIISASRATDIPAFYGQWLVDKFKKGFLIKTNPFNGKNEFIDLSKVRVIVFWTKNPLPFFRYLNFFVQKKINFYFLFTLNFYPEYELNLPSVEKRIEIFIKLAKQIGKQKVLWRFDPFIFSEEIDENLLLKRIEFVGNKIYPYTTRLIFSFLDTSYLKVKRNLKFYNKTVLQPSENQRINFVKKVKQLTDKWQIELRSCAENIDYKALGVLPNKCIDDDLMKKIFNDDKILQNFLNSKRNLRDKGQRKFCNCIYSKDIGAYDTCLHKCIYCYANKNFALSYENYVKIKSSKFKSLSLSIKN